MIIDLQKFMEAERPLWRELETMLVRLEQSTSRRLVARGRAFDPERVGAQVADLAWAGLRAVKRVN